MIGIRCPGPDRVRLRKLIPFPDNALRGLSGLKNLTSRRFGGSGGNSWYASPTPNCHKAIWYSSSSSTTD